MKIKKICKCILLMLCFAFLSCNLLGKNNAPYIIDGKMVLEDSSKYEIAGFDFLFINQNEKTVKNFTVVFYMFDEEGNPIGTGRNNVVLKVTSEVQGGKSIAGCINLDSYLNEIPSEPYEIEYLYVSQITYDDNSKWTDPFGLCVF